MVKTPRFWPPTALLLLGGCGDAGLVTLGQEAPDLGPFGPPRIVAELASPERNENPTFTRDGLEVFFISTRLGGLGGQDVWMSRRERPDAPFAAPTPVLEASHDGIDTSPAIDGDGLTLWVGTTRASKSGQRDIWVTHRATRTAAWEPLAPEPALESPADDIPRPPGGPGERVMPLSSKRDGGSHYDVYFATRDTAGRWGPTEHQTELDAEGFDTADAQLSADGRQVWFNRARSDGVSDIYRAWRRRTSDRFGEAVPWTELNTEFDDRDPFLLADGSRVYFASDRGGTMQIYEAERLPR